MSLHLGWYNTATIRTHVRFQFSTHAAAGGNVAPSSAFENADLRIYRANQSAAFSATQRSSANGITMTSPFDSLTGLHDVDIDLADNTDSGFYAAGYFYSIVLSPDETVDGQIIAGIVLAVFEIGLAAVDVAQWLSTAVPAPGTAGVPSVDAVRVSTSATAADNLETAALAYSATRGLTGTALPAVAAEAAGGVYTRGTGAGQINQQANGQVDANLERWINVAPLALSSQRVQVLVGAITNGVIAAATFAANALDAVWSTAARVLTAATNITSTGGTTVPQTGDSFARIGAAGAGLTGVPWNASWDAEVQSEVADALDAAVPGSPTANSINERVKTMDDADIPGRLPAALVGGRIDANAGAISADATAADRLEALMDGSPVVQVNGVATTTSIPIDGFTSTRNDQFNGRLLTVVDGSFEQTDIVDYVHATQTLSVTALSAAPADDAFIVIS